MNRKPGILAYDATGDTVRFSIGDDTLIRATGRSGVARATDAVMGSPTGEVFHAGEWLNAADLDALGTAMSHKRLAAKVTGDPHFPDMNEDGRCFACGKWPSQCTGDDTMPPEVVERVSAAIQAEVEKR